MKTAFLFPGQGAQQVGMGKDLYEAFPAAKAIFDTAAEITHLPITKLCFEGPEEELNRTDNAQPAIFTVSAALLASLQAMIGPDKFQSLAPQFMAGLSLGEYTALYAAGMIDFADALRLVARRGQAMQAAATATPSSMVAVTGMDETQANALCAALAQGEVLTCANFNCAGQIVLSGSINACKRAEEQAKDFGASGAVPLKVAGAFHSAIMQPAADALATALQSVVFRASAGTQVVANVDAEPYCCECMVPAKLLAQLTGSVRWQQSMEFVLAQGVEKFYEIGPGRVLAGLMRRINRKAEVVSINSRESLEKFAASI